MKDLLLTILCILTTYTGFSQITVSQAARRDGEVKKIQYDSTRNWLGSDNVESYVGQVLYVKGHGYPNGGYDSFKVGDNYVEYGGEGRYGRPAVDNKDNTKYEDLVGKYFKVISVKMNNFIHYRFKLQNIDNEDDIVWFYYVSTRESEFPFITLSHYNYIKNILVGNKYILNYTIEDGVIKTLVHDFDFYTGDLIKQSVSDVWECIDVTIEDSKYEFVALVKNQNGQVSYIDVKTLHLGSSTYTKQIFFNEIDYNNLVQKYGVSDMELVRQGFIKVGMSQELLILSWGTPREINRSSYGPEQWVYGNKYRDYVYIENGVITAWN